MAVLLQLGMMKNISDRSFLEREIRKKHQIKTQIKKIVEKFKQRGQLKIEELFEILSAKTKQRNSWTIAVKPLPPNRWTFPTTIKVFQPKLRWSLARATCIRHGGELASINEQEDFTEWEK